MLTSQASSAAVRTSTVSSFITLNPKTTSIRQLLLHKYHPLSNVILLTEKLVQQLDRMPLENVPHKSAVPKGECSPHQSQMHSLFFNYISDSKSCHIAAYFLSELYISYTFLNFLTIYIAFFFFF